jgi:hypothetical protein
MKNVDPDPAVCKLIPRAKSQGFFLANHNKNRHRKKDMAQLAKYVEKRKYTAHSWQQ